MTAKKVTELFDLPTATHPVPRLSSLICFVQETKVFASWTVIETRRYADGFLAGMGALRGAFLRPNIVFLRLPQDEERAVAVREVMARAPDYGLGIALFADHPRAGIGRQSAINGWVCNRQWETGHEVAEIDFDWARRMVHESRSSCLFVRGAGAESAVA